MKLRALCSGSSSVMAYFGSSSAGGGGPTDHRAGSLSNPARPIEFFTAALIVISALQEIDCGIGDAVDQAMLLSDSPGPTAAQHIFQRFGFSWAFEGVPHDRVNEIKDSYRDSAVVFDPKSEVLKKLGLKYGDPFSRSLH